METETIAERARQLDLGLGQRPKARRARRKTGSTQEAMECLAEAHGSLIERAREEAVCIARQVGEVHSRAVRERLEQLGLVDASSRDHWLGAVFRDERFRWSGRYFSYRDLARNVHERTIKIWVLI